MQTANWSSRWSVDAVANGYQQCLDLAKLAIAKDSVQTLFEEGHVMLKKYGRGDFISDPNGIWQHVKTLWRKATTILGSIPILLLLIYLY